MPERFVPALDEVRELDPARPPRRAFGDRQRRPRHRPLHDPVQLTPNLVDQINLPRALDVVVTAAVGFGVLFFCDGIGKAALVDEHVEQARVQRVGHRVNLDDELQGADQGGGKDALHKVVHLLDVVVALAEVARGVDVFEEKFAGGPVARVGQQLSVRARQPLRLPRPQQCQLGIERHARHGPVLQLFDVA